MVSRYRLIKANNATKNKVASFITYYLPLNRESTHDFIAALNSDLEVAEVPHAVLTIHVALQFCLQREQRHNWKVGRKK